MRRQDGRNLITTRERLPEMIRARDVRLIAWMLVFGVLRPGVQIWVFRAVAGSIRGLSVCPPALAGAAPGPWRWSGRGWCRVGAVRHPALGADRRLARARSRNTAAAAVTRAAATAIRAICQPGMPPAVITRTVGPVPADP